MFIRLRRLLLAISLADVVATQAALLLADFVRRFVPLGNPLGDSSTQLNPAIRVAAGIVFLGAFWMLAVYDVRRETRPVGDPSNVIRAVAIATLAFAGVLYFSFRDLPRLLVVYFFCFELGLLSVVRLLAGMWLRLLRKSGRALSRALLVGSGEAAAQIVEALRHQLGDSVELVGYAADSLEAAPGDLPLLGRLADVPAIVNSRAIDEVIIALPAAQYAAVEQLAYGLQTLPVRIRLVPDFLRLVVVQSSLESIGGMPLIGLREPRLSGPQWAAKRTFDVVLATLILICLWPVMLLIAAAIRMDSTGPVIFKQQRVGENGRLFWMYKFRSMVTNADMQQPEIQMDEQGRKVFKAPNDARTTRVGRSLRRTSLDELPQLFNVVRGEMSLVGPRPEQLFIVEQYEPWQRQRLAVPPGLTGWWQVNGRSDLPLHLNTEFDLYYIRNYSLWLDLMILLRTPWVVLRGRGAY